MPGIGVITNPKAKKNLKRPWIKESLQRIVGDVGSVYETRSIDELPALAHEFIDKGIEVLAVNGGDGTAHIALSHFIPIYQEKKVPLPKLLNLRGGTMNTISNSIKHKGKGEDILSMVVRKYTSGEKLEIIRQPILHINNSYGFMFGCGTVGNFMEQYYKGSSLGPWQAFKTVAKIANSAIFQTSLAKEVFASYESVLELDSRRLHLPNCTTVLICSIIEVGIGFKTNYRAYEKPGYVHVRGSSLSPFRFLRWLGHMHAGKRVPNEGILDEIAQKVRVKNEGRIPYTIDGELYKDTDEFTIEQGPVLNVIREGTKKLKKQIGLPGDWEKHALPEKTTGESISGNYRRADTDNILTL